MTKVVAITRSTGVPTAFGGREVHAISGFLLIDFRPQGDDCMQSLSFQAIYWSFSHWIVCHFILVATKSIQSGYCVKPLLGLGGALHSAV
ncbi:hypothetical protein QC590_04245 [Pseudomonas putida]|uniref:hypothetical protein n=1 Tax=Pseudomonas putida TaxID=303 RepID=UPI003363CCFF